MYEQLLSLNSKGRCHPQILRTSSGIHREAEGILYHFNEISIDYVRSYDSPSVTFGDCFETLKISGRPRASGSDAPFTDISEPEIWVWPAYLKKFSELSVSIIVRCEWLEGYKYFLETEWNVPNVFAQLAGYLQDCKKLKKVTIAGHFSKAGDHVDAEQLRTWCYPFTRLCALFDCTFFGFDKYTDIPRSMQLHAAEHKDFYRDNFWHRWRTVEKQSSAIEHIIEQSPDKRLQHEIAAIMDELEAVHGLSCTNFANEQKLKDVVGRTANTFTRYFREELPPMLTKEFLEAEPWAAEFVAKGCSKLWENE